MRYKKILVAAIEDLQRKSRSRFQKLITIVGRENLQNQI